MSITRSELQGISEQAVELLQDALGDEYLVTYEKGWYGDAASVKLGIAKADADGRIVTQMESDFRLYAPLHGLEADDFGARFKSRGSTYEITGWKPRNTKYPIIAKNVVTRDIFKFTVSGILAAKHLGGANWQLVS